MKNRDDNNNIGDGIDDGYIYVHIYICVYTYMHTHIYKNSCIVCIKQVKSFCITITPQFKKRKDLSKVCFNF